MKVELYVVLLSHKTKGRKEGRKEGKAKHQEE